MFSANDKLDAIQLFRHAYGILENNKIKRLWFETLHKYKRTLNSAQKPFELRDHDIHNISYETAKSQVI